MLTIVKRFFANNEKSTAKIVIQTAEHHIKVKCNAKQIIGYFEMTKTDEENCSVALNPFEFEKLIKGKGAHFDVDFQEGMVVAKETKEKVACESYDKDVYFEFEEWRDFNNSESFIALLKETSDLYEESAYEGTQYLLINNSSATAVGDKRVHKYNFNEDFYPSLSFIHGKAITLLSKTLKGDLAHSVYKGCLTIQNKNAFFILNSNKRVAYPDLRKMVREREPRFTFKIDATLVTEAIKSFKKLKLIEITFTENALHFNPRSEEYEPLTFPIFDVTGRPRTTVFDFETIKQFVASYDGILKVEHQRFKNIAGEEGFLWWSYEPHKMVMVAGVTEPDYQAEWEKEKGTSVS